MERTLTLETIQKVGEKVLLKGWVNTIRDHGKITFIDLRDRSGIVQCVGKDLPRVSTESVIEIEGEVTKRPENLVNKNIETGEVKVKISKLSLITAVKELPFPIDTDGLDIEEAVRLKYR